MNFYGGFSRVGFIPHTLYIVKLLGLDVHCSFIRPQAPLELAYSEECRASLFYICYNITLLRRDIRGQTKLGRKVRMTNKNRRINRLFNFSITMNYLILISALFQLW